MLTSDNSSDELYVPRLVDRVLPELLTTLPAISIVGPRGVGKTTTALHYAVDVRRLSRTTEAVAFRLDPYTMLGTLQEPALLDEWQIVPEVLSAVKESVDADPRAGRFILTGSVRIAKERTWQAAGRVVRLPIYPMTQREILANTAGALFVDRLRQPSTSAFAPAQQPVTILDYVEKALDGGLPDVIFHRQGRGRMAWLRSYMDEITTSDIRMTEANPDRRKFATYLKAVASSSATIVDDATLFDTAHVSRPTASQYDDLLESIYFADKIPAWWSDRLTRLTASPKRFVLDTSLLIWALSTNKQGILANAATLGRVIESFVAMQLRPEIAISDAMPTLSHLREKAGRREIDFIIEYADTTIAAVEVKSTSSPDLSDARHICWLRDTLGDRFLAGIVLHSGPYTLPLSDRVWAAPISTLWA